MERFKNITVKDRHFRLKKMDARKGSYMLLKVTNILTPLLKNLNLNELLGDDTSVDAEGKSKDVDVASLLEKIELDVIASALFGLEEKDFTFIQDNCLKAVEEVLEARNAPVLNNDGTYGVLGIEDDIVLVMNLTIQSLIFQVSGFFSGNLLTSLLKG